MALDYVKCHNTVVVTLRVRTSKSKHTSHTTKQHIKSQISSFSIKTQVQK